ncbi:MAG: VTT domain-containing protein [Chloroflexi bacterium]|nr:VTT domain-containing protein [Chloroflexota bacterium]
MSFDLPELIRTVGYLGLWGIIFAESWLIFFLPGDSLLFTAGFLASQGYLDIGLVMIGSFVSATAGNSIGYLLGQRVGRRLFQQDISFLFRKKHLLKAEAFYQKHGGKTIVLARFIPVVRTFAPVIAGVGVMQYRRFIVFNVLGAALWALGLPLSGYYLGQVIPDVDKYLLPIIAAIIVISFLPTAFHLYQEYRHQALAIVRTRLERR